jgi:hypothetical protein
LVEAGIGEEFDEGAVAEAVLEGGEVFKGAGFDEFVALAESAEVEDAGADEDGGFGGGGLAGDFEAAVDDVMGVEFVADFDDGGAGEEGVGADAEAGVGLGAVAAVEDEQAFARDRFVDHFGDAFPDPIEVPINLVFIPGQIRKREDDRGGGEQRREGREQEG